MAIEVQGVCPLLQVFDMPTSMAFYRDLLGFRIVQTSNPTEQGMLPGQKDQFDWVFLRLGEAELMLNTAYEADDRPPAPAAARIAAHDDTGLFFSAPDVDAVYRHLRAQGLDVEEPVTRDYGMKQVNVHDPDGYSLCFQWPAT